MKKFSSSLSLGVAHFLLFYMAIFIVTPKRTVLYAMVIWLGMIICSGLIVRFFLNKKKVNLKPTRLTRNHKKTQRLALFSAFLFLLTCISFKTLNHTNIAIPNTLTFMTVMSIIYTSASHIKLIDNKEKTIALRVKLAVKYSWLVVSLISYYLARSLTSSSWDIPFDNTFNKLITLMTALLFIFLIYYVIYFIFISLLYLMTLETKKGKNKSSVDVNYSISIFAPLFIIGYISYIAFNVQTLNVIKFGFKIAINYDMRDTFFCNDKYMFLNEYPNARFMFVSDGNYRALIPHHDDFTVSRLTCTHNKPFYSLVSVMDKKEVISSDLVTRAETLASDLKKIISANIR